MEEKREFKVSEKEVSEAIINEQFFKIGNKTTVCLLILNTGFEVVGSSAPVDPENFDFAVGKEIARENAINEVWSHLGSIVQWQKAIHDQGVLQAKARAEAEAAAAGEAPTEEGPAEKPTPRKRKKVKSMAKS